MSTRTPLIAGNWKMYKTTPEAVQTAQRIVELVADCTDVDIMIAPVFTALGPVSQVVRNSPVALGAQNLYWEKEGAYTGEIAAGEDSLLDSRRGCHQGRDRGLPQASWRRSGIGAGGGDREEGRHRLRTGTMSVTLTERAAQHVHSFLAKRGKGVGLRVGVRTSGCSGMAYKLEFADVVNPDDHAFESHGVKVLVDPKSLPYLDGTELDYGREGLNEGFKFQNPNVKDECGCGESFNV